MNDKTSAQTVIHPMAVVEKGAQLGTNVRIGPFCHVSADAVIGDDVELFGHVTIMGATTLGAGCKVYANAVLGGPPQNVKHKGGRTTLTVGKNCVIREYTTMHCGTDNSRGETTVGDNGLFMVGSHVGHDADVGSDVVMSNYTSLGGHAEIGEAVIISGYAAVHQFVRVGHHAFLGGYAAVVGDLIPYGMALGDRAKLRGLNVVGMRRAGMKRSDVLTVRRAYKRIFSPDHPLAENIEAVRGEFSDVEPVRDILDFLTVRGTRHLTVPPLGRGGDDDDGTS